MQKATGSERAPASPPESAAISRRAVAGWVLKGLGNTLQSQTMIANYFPVWVVAVMGGSDSLLTLSNTIIMLLMIGLGPWLGAVSDLLPRRMPVLIVTTVASALLFALSARGDLRLALVVYSAANLCFQASLIIYDALLPAVSTEENRGRINGLAVGLGYFGSLLSLGIGGLVLSGGGGYHAIFRLTAVATLLLALPCFVLVREPARAVARRAPLALARGALAGVAATLDHARTLPDLTRFLLCRTLYSMAGGAIGIFMAVYLTVELGYSSVDKDRLLLSAILGAVAGGLLWGRVVDLVGPRNALLSVLAVWSAALLAIAASGLGVLPTASLWFSAPLAGFALGGTWASDRPLMVALSPPAQLGTFFGLYGLSGRIAILAGPLVWTFVAQVAGLGRPAALVALTLVVLIAMALLRAVPAAVGRID
ncbi:MAG: MFS transporter [Thermomicrobiales bacterium]|nr:MFS transporter [Thermomicrobiales bacterium]